MKTSVILIAVACGIIAGAVLYLNKRNASPPPPTPAAETTAVPIPPVPPERIEVRVTESQVPPQPVTASAKTPVAISSANEVKADESTNAIAKAVDALLKAHGEKHDMLEQLRKSGQLDAVIAELQQRMAANPNDPEIPTTLGEAQLNKVRALKESGGDYNEIGILAMQADQNFNAALKLDPQNWEAQFVKYSSMTYWPANPEIDNQVVQNLANLIDQQEKMSPQPIFAQTYVLLGNEYQKIGQQQQAIATWQLGAQKFPNDPTLQQKISGAQ